MILSRGWLQSLAIAFCFGCLVACSPKAVVSSSSLVNDNSAELDTVSFVAKALQYTIPEYMVSRSSWENYQYALQAIDDEEWLLAGHYLDVSLKQLVLEKYDTTYTRYVKEDSLYRREMPVRILQALDEIYPNVAELGKEATTYLKNDISIEGHESLDDDVIDTADLVEIENFLDTLDLSQFSLPIELNERVMREIHYLSKVARTFTEGSLSRKTLYDSLIYSKLKEEQLPEDLIFLALVESGFKLKAYSRAKASGLWQFIPETGKRYGLDVNYWVDMRRNPELATKAALSYLKRLHNEFNDWLLAIAAYNCGEGRIRRLLREARSDSTMDSSRVITYWELQLPKETMHYVPRILAAMVIGHYPEHYDLIIEPQVNVPFDTITVFDCLPLDVIAKAVGVSEDSIRSLNPELIKAFTPPDQFEYVLRIPFGSRDVFAVAYEEMDKSQFSRWFHHKVKSGENLGVISRKYGLSISAIQSANGMKNTKLRAGQTLLIPLPSVSNKKSSPNKLSKPYKAKEYVVKLGDNFASIARKFGISVDLLKSWNSLGDNSILKVSDTLYVSKPKLEEKNKKVSTPQLPIKKYTVKEGDSYHSIALALGVSSIDLMKINKGMQQRLKVGEEIQVPFPKPKAKVQEKQKIKVWAPKKKDFYVVQNGDNLYSISKKLGITVSDLQNWNNKGTNTNIYPGEKLKLHQTSSSVTSIPQKVTKISPTPQNTTDYHVVEKGESLWDIARRYKISIAEIVKWNNLQDTKVKVGDRLKIKAN